MDGCWVGELWGAYEDLLLPRILPTPIRVLLEAVRVQRAPDVTTTSRIFVVVPGAADAAALLEDDKVVALVAFDQVDGHAHALGNTSVCRVLFPRYLGTVQSNGENSCGFGWRSLPEMPAPMMTTAAEVWSLLPTGTWGQGFEPPMLIEHRKMGGF